MEQRKSECGGWYDGTKQNWQENFKLQTGKLPDLLKFHEDLYPRMHMVEIQENTDFYAFKKTPTPTEQRNFLH